MLKSLISENNALTPIQENGIMPATRDPDHRFFCSGLQADKLQKIKPQTFSKTTKTSEDLFSEEEILSLIEHSNNARDRAFIAMLYEGGFRIGELGELKWKQVKFNDWNVAVSIEFKTGKSRHIPLVMSRSYLQAWANEYQGKMTPDSFVFVTRKGEPIQYHGIVKMIRTTATRAGIERHITPHLFRHSRITHLIRQGYQESVVKRMYWGNLDTDMFSVYLHLIDDDVDNEIAAKMGIKKPGRPTKESKALEAVQCPRCYTVHGPTARFCDQCGAALTLETGGAMKGVTSDIDQDPRLQRGIEIMKKELGIIG